MRVTVYCCQCKSIDENGNIAEQEMDTDGWLYTNQNKDQTQVYVCPRCNSSVIVTINTIENQS